MIINNPLRLRQIAAIVFVIVSNSVLGQAASEFASPTQLKKLSIEELMDLEVTSVSRRPEKLTETPSAVQVITQEDIRRSGASSLPEALRLATNLHVAQKNSHDWAISARGFNTDLSNKLLVLIDGRTVYTPLFSGVFWDRQDYLLEDIERIEVISGPGSTLWGSNAVNGIINIITKNSANTNGVYAEAGAGTMLRHFAGVRYGGTVGDRLSFRVYGKYFNRGESAFPDGTDANDSWRMLQGGFRVDTKSSKKNNYTFQGDYYNGNLNLSTGGTAHVNGNNILTRWTRKFSESSNISVQLYYDRTHLDQPTPASMTEDNTVIAPEGTLKDDLNTYDVDFQHSFSVVKYHQLVWGLAFRRTHDKVENAPGLAFVPEELDRNLYSIFVQDEITIINKLLFILGIKIEHNDYTGFEYSPSVRLQSNIRSNQTIWAAVSRAVRIPSRVDTHIRFPTPAFAPLGIDNLLVGGENFKSETVIAYELGYRVQFGNLISASFATFYNDYDNIRSTSLSPPDPIFGLPFPLFYENNLEGENYGIELTIAWQLFDWWKLNGGYALLKENVWIKNGKTDFNNAINETADPENRFSLRSWMNLSSTIHLDFGLRSIGSFTFNNNVSADKVPGYTELEARVGWFPVKGLELSVTGQNLLKDQHLEYVISNPNPRAEIRRSVYLKVAYQL
jgi:iron complex outermembrane recepter protein